MANDEWIGPPCPATTKDPPQLNVDAALKFCSSVQDNVAALFRSEGHLRSRSALPAGRASRITQAACSTVLDHTNRRR
jgi:hypothetical protein